ncbi:DUF4846 domain-containing protein [Lewinella cohaerens]|uniref:DUF4846 domain-containing protein n=1 Tax=Lewinella cohaerens TaxID=70995 RepID=UPI00036A7064
MGVREFAKDNLRPLRKLFISSSLKLIFFGSFYLLLLACSTEGSTDVVAHSTQENVLLDTVYTLDTIGNTIEKRFPVPVGFSRVEYDDNTFAYFLRTLPLKSANSPVYLYDGSLKRNQAAVSAVVDIDVGRRDLQQCADAVIRLRAEYLWQQKEYDAIQFHFTNGFLAKYTKWRSGQRIRVNGNEVSWTSSRGEDSSYKAFRSYLNMVFAYAGTLSVAKELKEQSLSQIEAGDVFIQGGSPGHAIIVVDMVVHPETHQKRILLAQSYMPAQDIHVLQNPNADSPWYEVSTLEGVFRTPEWSFKGSDLRKF